MGEQKVPFACAVTPEGHIWVRFTDNVTETYSSTDLKSALMNKSDSRLNALAPRFVNLLTSYMHI